MLISMSERVLGKLAGSFDDKRIIQGKESLLWDRGLDPLGSMNVGVGEVEDTQDGFKVLSIT